MACCWDRRLPSRMHAPAGADVGARTCGLAQHGPLVARVMEETRKKSFTGSLLLQRRCLAAAVTEMSGRWWRG